MRKILLILSVLSTIAVAEPIPVPSFMDDYKISKNDDTIKESIENDQKKIGITKSLKLNDDAEQQELIGLIKTMSYMPYVPKINYIAKISDIHLICEKIAKPIMLDDPTGLALRASCISVLTSLDSYKDQKNEFFIRVRVLNVSKECEKMKLISKDLLKNIDVLDVEKLPVKINSTCLVELTKLKLKKI